jgi:hypothetical protein
MHIRNKRISHGLVLMLLSGGTAWAASEGHELLFTNAQLGRAQ